MYAIQDKLVSEDIFTHEFVCNLDACKGACCWEGDIGAPVLDSELKELDKVNKIISTYLPLESVKIIEKNGGYEKNKVTESYVTSLRKDGACVYMNQDEKGIAYCGIEKAYNEGKTKFKKPVSCHLYPIRILENKTQGFTAVNYDRWKICNPACKNGKKLGVPVFQFVKDGLIRRFGREFFRELNEVYKRIQRSS
ncbi:MAG: DUF3109 family protein [Saprospiraceae bacterium]|nr:DUF3109 family protein [Saprospiraceae bacterium]